MVFFHLMITGDFWPTCSRQECKPCIQKDHMVWFCVRPLNVTFVCIFVQCTCVGRVKWYIARLCSNCAGQQLHAGGGLTSVRAFSCACSLVPSLLPAFQCCTLKSERAWYLIARASHVPVQSMGRVEYRATHCHFLKSPFTGECWLCRKRDWL